MPPKLTLELENQLYKIIRRELTTGPVFTLETRLFVALIKFIVDNFL